MNIGDLSSLEINIKTELADTIGDKIILIHVFTGE
jgi:hypothetical protein